MNNFIVMGNVGNSSFIFSVSSISPCPGVFDYQQSISGEWYGRISVPNPFPILAIDIAVELYVAGDVPMVIPLPNFLAVLEHIKLQWNLGSRT
jgi:hypothetical protein